MVRGSLWRVVGALFAASLLAACANTRDFKADTAQFDWSQTQKKVVVVQPDVELGELTTGGMVEPRADWTQAARGFMRANIDRFMSAKAVTVVPVEDVTDPHEFQLVKLQNAVGAAVIIHKVAGVDLPNKKSAIDWTLGPGANALRDHYGADYAMFFYVRDSYTSAGRVLLMLGAAALGIGIQGGNQVAFVSLVDLRTGNIVWFNFLVDPSGDLRNDKDTATFVKTILKDMPL